MWIKICGNTNLEDARLASEGGADAAGFVFAPSKRKVTEGQVAAITPALPFSFKKIGVFGSHSFDEIAFTVRAAGLNGVQLHGDSDLHLVERMRKEFGGELFLIQTLHCLMDGDSDKAEQKFRDDLRAVIRHNCVDAVLIDARTATASGGTGTSFDWVRARAILDDEAGSLRIIVAGGLRPENVRDAISVLKPWGVDVVSGVEAVAGKKDPERLLAFLRTVREAAAEENEETQMSWKQQAQRKQ
jgi:phosphoribosylanthranilate isomerase